MYQKYLLFLLIVVATVNVATAEVFLPTAAVTSRNTGFHPQSSCNYQSKSPGLSHKSSIRKWIQHTCKSIHSNSNRDTHGMAFADVSSFYRNFPYMAAFLTCGIKGVSADLIVQSSTIKRANKLQVGKQKVEKKSIDLRRAVSYLLYGALYQGMAQEYLYNNAFPVIFGTAQDLKTVASKVIFGTYILTPLVTLPTVYFTKAMVFGYSFKQALQEYIYDIKEKGLLKKCWLLWTPVNGIAFALIPEHFRITFIAMVSFLWVMILSAVTAK